MPGAVLIAGVGNPWLGDLDFGPRFVRRYAGMPWPPNVVLREAALAAHRMLHEIQELAPARVVFVAGFPRGGTPGTVRRYHISEQPLPAEEEVQARLAESAGGVIDLDHTLAVTRYYGALPEDTVVVEVEPMDTTFGDRFSPPVEAAFDAVLSLVREEIARD